MSTYTIEQGYPSLRSYRINEALTVEQLLTQLKLNNKFFAVIVNGKKANLTTVLHAMDEVLLLPRVAGG